MGGARTMGAARRRACAWQGGKGRRARSSWGAATARGAGQTRGVGSASEGDVFVDLV